MSWPLSFQQTNVACAVLGVGIALWRRLPLEGVVGKLLAASALPTGILLLGCAFNTNWISKLSDLGIYLLAAAVALLYVSLKELLK
jgi:hypothetical protein